ncbi:MAG: crossover junction endodeoxyribonuclease RuvC [Rhodoluna sp.]|nr:crossover junction endodeoxyribonuclease RuvC [Rhodoluna sp.]MBP7818988.1 crossover junction endodeoxyribonuclease RuvC [Rhodoluna sp.]
MTTRILGIDPGLTRCGIGLIELGASRRVSLIAVDTYRSEPTEDLSVRVGRIGLQIEDLIQSEQPQVIAIERVFSQQNLSTVMGTAQISGAVLMLAHKHKIPVVMYTPTQVKAAVTGSGRAAKEQVGYMVAKILGLTEIPKPADAADSLAIAICHAWRSPAASESTNLTKAQKAWLDAERAAKTK